MLRLFQCLCLVLVFLCINTVSVSQEKEKPKWSFGANPYYGGVMRYKPDMPKLKFTNLYGIELYANKLTNGSKAWQSLYNYPHVGFAASYFNYGDPDELGEVFSLATYLDFTVTPNKKHQWRFNIGTGIVYSTKYYDAETNPANKAISNEFSYILRGTIHHEIQLSEQYYFNLNFAFRHYSNGKLNLPNNGMNYPIIGVGVRYVPKPKGIVYYKDTVKYDKKIHLNMRVSTSWRQVWQEDYNHKAYSASIYLSKRITKFNSLLLGVDGFYYDSESMHRALISWKVNNPAIPDDYELNFDGRQLAITGGTEIYFGNMSVVVQGGVYVYKPQEIYESTWYQRYGLKYAFTKNIFTQVSLKSHSRTADLVEFGGGLSF